MFAERTFLTSSTPEPLVVVGIFQRNNKPNNHAHQSGINRGVFPPWIIADKAIENLEPPNVITRGDAAKNKKPEKLKREPKRAGYPTEQGTGTASLLPAPRSRFPKRNH
jgi:hypothetical protein